MINEQQIPGKGLREENPPGVSGATDHLALIALLNRLTRHGGKVLMPFKYPFGVQGIVPMRKAPRVVPDLRCVALLC
ncbi:hypothetical protein ACIQ9K_05375 [Streptomyces microflavus]|uniref:hypothetical protein n=1 Tax=Streptomyces microflavus TaxID=1919 RepID=UPI0037FAF478